MKLKLPIKGDGLKVGETFSQFPGNGTITILKLGVDSARIKVIFWVGSERRTYNCTGMRWAIAAEKAQDRGILGMSPSATPKTPKKLYLRPSGK